MKNKRHRKKTRKLFNRELMGDFEKRLAAYGLTAALLLAGPQPAKAAEVVWDIPDLTLGSDEYLAFNVITGAASLDIDNRPYGVSTQGSFAIDNVYFAASIIGPANSALAGFVGTGGFTNAFLGYRYAAALNPSSSVGTARDFAANSYFPNWGNYGIMDNNFNGTTGKSVGLRFEIGSEIHYGWAQVDIGTGGSDVTLTMFGYNDTAGEASHIPEPSSLGLLALGAAGLARRRRKKTQV